MNYHSVMNRYFGGKNNPMFPTVLVLHPGYYSCNKCGVWECRMFNQYKTGYLSLVKKSLVGVIRIIIRIM